VKDEKNTRDRLIEVATRLFAAQGFDGTTTREIVEEAGLNISLITYHFGGKDGLLVACLELAAKQIFEVPSAWLTKIYSREQLVDLLANFAKQYLQLRLDEPFAHLLIQRELERNSPHFKEVFLGSYLETFQKLPTFIRSAQKQGFFKPDLDANTLAIAIIGSLGLQLRLDHIRQAVEGRSLKDPETLDKVVRDLTTWFSHGFLCPPKEAGGKTTA